MPGVRCQHHASQSGPAFLVLLSQQGHHCSPVLVGERCWRGAGAHLGAMGGCRKGAPCRCSACNSTHGFAAKSLLWVCRGAEQLSLQHPAPASRMPAASRSASCSLLSTFSLTEGGEKPPLALAEGIRDGCCKLCAGGDVRQKERAVGHPGVTLESGSNEISAAETLSPRSPCSPTASPNTGVSYYHPQALTGTGSIGSHCAHPKSRGLVWGGWERSSDPVATAGGDWGRQQ